MLGACKTLRMQAMRGIFYSDPKIYIIEEIAKLSHSVIPAMILSGKTKFNVHNLVLTA